MIRNFGELWHGRLGRYVPLLLCVGLILFLSGSEASMSKSSRYLRPILEFLFPSANEASLALYIIYIRKFSHVFEYMVLAILAARAFFNSPKSLFKDWWYGLSLLVVGIVAVADETIQSFNPLRTGSVSDVILDLTGGLIGVMAYFLVRKALSYVLSPQAEMALDEKHRT